MSYDLEITVVATKSGTEVSAKLGAIIQFVRQQRMKAIILLVTFNTVGIFSTYTLATWF
jgi:hypothetical protein